MTLRTLLKRLRELQTDIDPEGNHVEADKLLLEFIDNVKVTEEYDKIDKWYA